MVPNMIIECLGVIECHGVLYSVTECQSEIVFHMCY